MLNGPNSIRPVLESPAPVKEPYSRVLTRGRRTVGGTPFSIHDAAWTEPGERGCPARDHDTKRARGAGAAGRSRTYRRDAP